MLLVHVPARTNTHIASLQFQRIVRGAFEAAEIEHLDIHEAEPPVTNIKAQYVAAVPVGYVRERHLFMYPFQREAIFPELFYIHKL